MTINTAASYCVKRVESLNRRSCWLCKVMICVFLSLQLVKLCSGMIEAGRAYVSANKLFVNGIKDLSQQCKKEETISVSGSDKTSQLSSSADVSGSTCQQMAAHLSLVSHSSDSPT